MLAELLSDLRYRLRALFRRRALDQDLEHELRFHIEQEASKHVRAGDPPAEALRKARAAFGGLERIKEDTRDARGLALLDSITQDLRYAVRGLRSTPGFTLAVVLTLALGIGANAAVFGVLDRLMFRPPPYLREPRSVHRVYLASTFRGQPLTWHTFEYKRYLDLTGATRSFAQIAAFTTFPAAVGAGQDVTEAVVGTASAGFFDFFDARPTLGRFFTSAEDSMPAGTPVAVLDYGYWQSRFGGRRDILGLPIQIGPLTVTIIGVAPSGFSGVPDGRPPIAWVPITAYAWSRRHNYYLKLQLGLAADARAHEAGRGCRRGDARPDGGLPAELARRACHGPERGPARDRAAARDPGPDAAAARPRGRPRGTHRVLDRRGGGDCAAGRCRERRQPAARPCLPSPPRDRRAIGAGCEPAALAGTPAHRERAAGRIWRVGGTRSWAS